MNRTNMNAWMRRLLVAAASLACFGAFAQVPPPGENIDPPLRVGRLADFSGAVSYSPAGDDQWVLAPLNRPIVSGDRLWADEDGRVEVSMDNGSWFLGPRTSVTVSNLDDRTTQLQLQQGTLDFGLRRMGAGSIVEIDTPNVAFSLTRPGSYRIEVDPDGGSTTVIVRSGMGTVFGDETSYVVTGGQAYRFFGTNLSDNEFLAVPPFDPFDQWVAERERRYVDSISARYVSPEVVGYADLDRYGSWGVVGGYGNVWFPRGLAVGWAPYRYGHWVWIDPWGWTWVDDAPWGFAPFHYGRWVHADRGWGWVPGPAYVRPYYAPALVAFVGGPGFSISVSAGPSIGWFPLGPREVYRPPYHVSRGYFERVNVSNTIINTTTITNVYNNINVTQVNYANMRVRNAVTAVPTAAFASSEQVHRVALPLAPAALASAQVQPAARIAPSRTAFTGATPLARARPPAAVEQRAVVARVAPPPPPVPVSRQLPVLEKNPGQPINRAQVRTLRAEAPVTAPAVRIVGQNAKPAPTAAPPARRGGVPPAQAQPGTPQQRIAPQGEAIPPQRKVPQAAPVPEMRSTPQRAGPPTPAAPQRVTPEPGIAPQRAGPQPGGVQERAPAPQVRKAPEPTPAPAREPQTRREAVPQTKVQPPPAERPAAVPQTRREPVPQAKVQPPPAERPAAVPQTRREPVPQAQVQQRVPERPAAGPQRGNVPAAHNAPPRPEPARGTPKAEQKPRAAEKPKGEAEKPKGEDKKDSERP
jgi:Family of unknown function (DUF6600)